MIESFAIDSFTTWYKLEIGMLGLTHTSYDSTSIHSLSEEESARYAERPEYTVGRRVETAGASIGDLKEAYLTLLAGIYSLRLTSKCNTTDEAKELLRTHDAQLLAAVDHAQKWLLSTDFFTAPASTRFHDSFTGGLLAHSLNVYNETIGLLKVAKFKNVNPLSALLVALVHDWCKINFYEGYKKNVKDEATGQWHQEDAWRVNQKGIPLGHGVSSMFLAQKLFTLSADECLAIRWHMGAWRVCESEIDELEIANEKIPLVHLVQFADQLALVSY